MGVLAIAQYLLEPAAGAGMLVLGLTGLAISLRRRRGPSPLVRLRRCPVCGSEAVSAITRQEVDGLHTQVTQRCGQCGAWCRSVSAPWVVMRHERMLQDDRSAIRRDADRLEREREAEIDGFVSVLCRDITTAQDLLSRIPARTSARPDLDP